MDLRKTLKCLALMSSVTAVCIGAYYYYDRSNHKQNEQHVAESLSANPDPAHPAGHTIHYIVHEHNYRNDHYRYPLRARYHGPCAF